MPELFSEKKSTGKWWAAWVVLVICILVSGVCFAVYYVYPDIFHMEEDDNGPCLTENCLRTTYEIMASIDTSQDPCVDFYQFTCGNFISEAYRKNNPSPYYAQTLSNIFMRDAIISEPITGNENKPLLLQKKFYQSCMNETAIDEDEKETVKNLIEEVGGWPILKGQKWKENAINLKQLLIQCQSLGLPFQWFFQVLYKEDSDQILIHPPVIPEYNYTFQETVYATLIVETAVNFKTSALLATYEADKIIIFEKELQKIVKKNKESSIDDMDTYQLHASFPQFSLFEFVKELTQDLNYTITKNSKIASNAAYLDDLNLLFARTSKRVQVNYVIWKIIQEFGPYLATPIREYFINYTNFMTSKDQQTPTRYEFCIKEATTRFPNIAETEFVNLYVSKEKSQNIIGMIKNIKDQFISRLKAATWIDKDTKKLAINKVKNIVEMIGQHNLDFNEDILQKFLNTVDLEFTSENVIDIIREKNINDFKQKFLLKDVQSVDDVTLRVLFKTLEINAAYGEPANIIILSAGITQGNIYSENRPNYLNYGALGSIIGHEIAHGFDTDTYAHDSEEEKAIIAAWFNESLNEIMNISSLNTSNLWQGETANALFERMRCVIEDHKNFDAEVNGEESANENSADLIGIDISYEAYSKWVDENGEEAYLPGLTYTPAQLYWIQFGIMNCYTNIPSVSWHVIEGEYPSLRYRVINPLRNSENFARDFECPIGSPMNPERKCRIF